MKTAGIARALGLAMTLVLVGMLSAVSAAAGPLKASVPSRGDAIASGTDVFWTSDRETKPVPKTGYSSTTSLWRKSLIDGQKALLKRFDPTDTATGFPEEILAGGGYVYVNMSGDGPDGQALESSSAVLRMARDGSGLQKLTSGTIKSSEEDAIIFKGQTRRGKFILNDCGIRVSAELVTSDGSVVIRETKSDRESKECGRKKNVDHLRLYLLSPAGVTREILTADLKIKKDFQVQEDGSYEGGFGAVGRVPEVVDVAGDRVLIARGSRPSYYVRDLTTGTESGPFKTKLSSRFPFDLGTLDPSGRVAVSTVVVTGTTRKNVKSRVSSGIFQNPADRASFTPAKGRAFLMFCGRHLISLTERGVRELDPVTLNLIRTISPIHKDGSVVWLNNPCSDDYLYMSKSKGRGSTVRAYPLGP